MINHWDAGFASLAASRGPGVVSRRLCAALFATLSAALPLAAAPIAARPAPQDASPSARQWWADVSALADDRMEGRLTGSPGYERAADYVVRRFEAEGLEPGGVDGYRQPVAFEQQLVDQEASRADLIDASGAETPLRVGEAMLVSAGGAPRPAQVDAPLVFAGYGLRMNAQGYDDFAGLDLRGKIVVVISGGPQDIPGPIKSNARSERVKILSSLGAAGVVTLTTRSQIEIPWARQKLLSGQPGMYLADAGLRDTPDGFFVAAVDPDRADLLFRGAASSFADLSALADASKPLPRIALSQRLRATLAVRRAPVLSSNLVAKLRGSDPELAAEYVAISAHLDHLGVGAPIKGDKIYHGAMDDASGVAAVLDIARRLKTSAHRPRRSVLFLIFTAEEKGLLGSRFYAMRPTVPKGSIVADLNFDMPLPLWPLRSVIAHGEHESTLGDDARAAAAAQGLALVADPLPDRNVFIRTDQYSFVRNGVPALAFKFGFAKGTPEFDREHDWRAVRYHAPSDDLLQPGVMKEEAVKLDAFVTALALRVADADSRPTWRSDSIFGHAPSAR